MTTTATYTVTTTPFGLALRTFREARRLSQSKLATKAGFDHSYVSRLESGAREPSRDAVQTLASALDLDKALTDEFLATGGFLPVDPASLFANEPELVAVLTVLRSPATPDVRRVGIRAVLGALADLGAGDTTVRADVPTIASESPESGEGPVTRQIPYVHRVNVSAAITAPRGKRAA